MAEKDNRTAKNACIDVNAKNTQNNTYDLFVGVIFLMLQNFIIFQK